MVKFTNQTARVRYQVEDSETIYVGCRVASGALKSVECTMVVTGQHVVYTIGNKNYLVSHKEVLEKILTQEAHLNR